MTNQRLAITFDLVVLHIQHSGRMKSLNVRTPGDRLLSSPIFYA